MAPQKAPPRAPAKSKTVAMQEGFSDIEFDVDAILEEHAQLSAVRPSFMASSYPHSMEDIESGLTDLEEDFMYYMAQEETKEKNA